MNLPVITRKGVNSLGEELTYVFNYSLEAVSVQLAGDNAGGYTDIITGKSYEKDEAFIIKDRGLMVIK